MTRKIEGGEFRNISEGVWKDNIRVSSVRKEEPARQAELMKILQHPNVIRVYGVCKEPLHIITELIGNLLDHLRGKGTGAKVPQLITMCCSNSQWHGISWVY